MKLAEIINAEFDYCKKKQAKNYKKKTQKTIHAINFIYWIWK